MELPWNFSVVFVDLLNLYFCGEVQNILVNQGRNTYFSLIRGSNISQRSMGGSMRYHEVLSDSMRFCEFHKWFH